MAIASIARSTAWCLGLLVSKFLGGVGGEAKQTGFCQHAHGPVQMRSRNHRNRETFIDQDMDGRRHGCGISSPAHQGSLRLVWNAGLDLTPCVDGSHIRIKTEEFQATGRQDHALALSKLDMPPIAIDRDAAFQNGDEKMIILSARAMPSPR